jgi:hypothetical protein
MHLFKVAFYSSVVIYAIFFEQRFFIPFTAIILLYVLFGYVLLPGTKDLSNRKKVRQSHFSDPIGGYIVLRIPVRTEKVTKLIK